MAVARAAFVLVRSKICIFSDMFKEFMKKPSDRDSVGEKKQSTGTRGKWINKPHVEGKNVKHKNKNGHKTNECSNKKRVSSNWVWKELVGGGEDGPG